MTATIPQDRSPRSVLAGFLNDTEPRRVDGVLVRRRLVVGDLGPCARSQWADRFSGGEGDVVDTEALLVDLGAYCRVHLARYKVPRRMEVLDKLPRQPTGKLYKRLLRDPHWEGTGHSI